MCLEQINKNAKCKSEGYGYKVYDTNCRGYIFMRNNLGNIYYSDGDYGFRNNKWYKAEKTILYDGFDNHYMSGFHIFLNKRDAIRHAKSRGFKYVVRVKYKDARIVGTQWDKTVIVANSMRIIRRIWEK